MSCLAESRVSTAQGEAGTADIPLISFMTYDLGLLQISWLELSSCNPVELCDVD